MTRKALVLGEILEREVVEQLISYDVSCVGSKTIKEAPKDKFDLIILKNYLGPLKEIKEAFPGVGFVSLGPVLNMNEFIHNNGKALLNAKFLGLDLVDEFFGRFLNGQTSSLNLEYLFRDKIDSLENIKVSGHMSTGYYMDLIATDMYEKDYNVIAFREYFSSLISYLAYLKKAGIAGFPFEFEYGEVDNQFVLQCSINISHFVTEYIMESFLPESIAYPLRGLLSRCYNLADLFDISHIEKKSRLVFTAVWLNTKTHSSSGFNSFFLNRVYNFDYKKEKNFSLLKAPKAFLADTQNEIIQRLEDKELPGYFADMFLNRELLPSAQPTFLVKLVRFIQEEYDDNGDIKPLASFSKKDVKHYLSKFPDKEMVRRLKDDDYDFILNCLGSLEHMEKIDKLVTEVTSLVDAGEYDTELKDKIKVKIDDVIQEDIQRVRGRFDEDDSSQIVSGKIDEDQSSQLVSGKIEEDDTVQTISGKPEKLDDDQWKLKHSQFADEAIELLRGLDKEKLTKDNFRETLIELVKDKFNLSTQEAEAFLERIFGGSVEAIVNDEVLRRMQEELGVEGDVEFASLLKKIEEKERANEALQQNIESLRLELNTLKQLSVGDSDDIKTKYFQLTKLNEMKERLINNLKKQVESVREESDYRITELSDKNKNLQKEVIDLRGSSEQSGDQRKNIEISKLTKQVQTKDTIISELQDKNKNLQLELSSKPKATDMENKVIASLTEQKEILVARVKKAEDETRGKSVDLKKSSVRVKQLEEKLVLLRAQAEKQEKRLRKASGVSGTKGKGPDIKVKQLELRIKKLNEINEKNKESVSKAKRDAIQFKNTNTQLQNEINELKRKLAVKR